MSDQLNDDSERNQNLVFALSKARNLVAAELDAGLKDVGVNVQERGVLLTLLRESVKSPVALSKLLGVHPGRMTRVLDRLESSGWVQRSRNVTDRRVIDVSLTQEGRQKAAQSEQLASATGSQRRLAHFTKTDFDALSKLLTKLLRG